MRSASCPATQHLPRLHCSVMCALVFALIRHCSDAVISAAMEPAVTRGESGYFSGVVSEGHVSKAALCATHSQQIPAQPDTAASSKAFTETMKSRSEHNLRHIVRSMPCGSTGTHRATYVCARRSTNTFEVAAGSTQWRTTSNSTPHRKHVPAYLQFT